MLRPLQYPEGSLLSLEELSDGVRSMEKVRIAGADSNAQYRLPGLDASVLRMDGFSGIVDFSPNDQVVVVRAGTSGRELQSELGSKGQCLPIVGWDDGYSHLDGILGTIGGALSINLPHYLDAECGNWRDWVLGMTLVMADGTIVKVGSKAVKNVAGYDLQKLIIGSRGTLAVVAEVVLRTFPIASLPTPEVTGTPMSVHETCECGNWVQRTLAGDFARACAAAGHLPGFDVPSSHTLWRYLPASEDLPRYEGDWVIRSGAGEKNLQIDDPTLTRYMRRAKGLFDPTHKLNPGEMGIF